MHGDEWTGELVLAGLVAGFSGLAVWSPDKEALEPLLTERIEATDLLMVSSHVLGRCSSTRIKLLIYASRCSRSCGGISPDDYCEAINWPKSSFWAAAGRIASHLNARNREIMDTRH